MRNRVLKVWIDSAGNIVWHDGNADPFFIRLDVITRRQWTHWLCDGTERDNPAHGWMVLE